MQPEIAASFAPTKPWIKVRLELRRVLLESGLDEAIKWNKPCYSHQGHNIAILQSMKAFMAVMFFRGALLDDPEGLLRSQGPNSRSAKRLEFTSVQQVVAQEPQLRALIAHAKAVALSGEQLPPAPKMVLVAELAERLDADPALKKAFEGLTPGRQRHYNMFISQAKQAKTRIGRIDKNVQRILAGKGLRDR